LDCTLVLEMLEQKKFNPRYLEKLVSSQGNKVDIDKRRRKKKDVQVSSTPRATETPVNIVNPEHIVNL